MTSFKRVFSRYVSSFLITFFMFTLLKLGNTSQKNDQWSFLVLAQRWPPSACLDFPPGKCFIPEVVSSWIIHGLWKSQEFSALKHERFKGSLRLNFTSGQFDHSHSSSVNVLTRPTRNHGYPQFCNKSWAFQVKDIESILGGLEAKWPNIMKGTSEASFWKHEWVKHGTCAASVSSMNNVLKYFTQTVKLHDKFNFYEILRKSVVSPGKIVYVLQWIEAGIQLQLKKKIQIFCKSHKDYEFPILDTVYFCFDKQFNLIDCKLPAEKSCNSSRVIYPPFK